MSNLREQRKKMSSEEWALALKGIFLEYKDTPAHDALLLLLEELHEAALQVALGRGVSSEERAHAMGACSCVRSITTFFDQVIHFTPEELTREGERLPEDRPFDDPVNPETPAF